MDIKIKNGFYYHYKHDPKGAFNTYSYEVIGIGRNSEEKTFTVIYRPIYKNDWLEPADYQSRPYEMFIEDVLVGGKTMPRFTQITDPKIIAELKKIQAEMYGG